MKLITRQSRANEAAALWRYYSDRRTGTLLVALGEAPNPDDVDAAIGNGTWTSVPGCDECGASTSAVVQLGEEPDYESSTACVCLGCLRKAVELIEAPGAK